MTKEAGISSGYSSAALGTFFFYNLCFSANKVYAALGSKGLFNINNKIGFYNIDVKVALLLHIVYEHTAVFVTIRSQGHDVQMI